MQWLSRLICCSSGGPRALAHAGENLVCAAVLSRLFDNLPRFGGRAVGIGLKIIKGTEYTVITCLILDLPVVEVGGSTRNVFGVGLPGRISLGCFLLHPPSGQVSTPGAGGRVSSLKLAGDGIWIVGVCHWDCLPCPLHYQRILEDTDQATLSLPS